jgi:hypothetical protein
MQPLLVVSLSAVTLSLLLHKAEPLGKYEWWI